MSQNCISKVLLAILSPHRRTNVAWMSRYWPLCSNATFKLFLHFLTLVNSNFWCANRILRQAEFQICITLPHQWASETCRNRNSFIPTFSGHWSPDPSPRSGSWEPDYDHHDIMLRRQINSVFLCSMFECQILDILWLRNYNQYSKWSKGPRNVKKKT